MRRTVLSAMALKAGTNQESRPCSLKIKLSFRINQFNSNKLKRLKIVKKDQMADLISAFVNRMGIH